MIKDEQIRENFKFSEFISKLETENPTPTEVINIYLLSGKLQTLRNIVGPIKVNSGWRGVKENKRVKGSLNSHHLKGYAGDINFDKQDWNRKSLEKIFKMTGFKNVNFYILNGKVVWCHVDIGPTWNGLEYNYRDLDYYTHKEL